MIQGVFPKRVQINNEANQNVGVRSNGLTYAAAGINRDPSAFGVGLVHSF